MPNNHIDSVTTKKKVVLVTGPSAGGKSQWAEEIMKGPNKVTYIATGSIVENDAAWIARIEKHRKRRPKEWELVESSTDLSQIINQKVNEPLLIDSLGGFVSCYLEYNHKDWKVQEDLLIKSIMYHNNLLTIVIEEVGWGIVPHTKIGNLFRDRIGLLAQRIEEISTSTWLVILGRAIDIKEISFNVKS